MLDESEIPEEYLAVSRQMAIARYRLAYQKADMNVSGDRMKSLASENAEVMTAAIVRHREDFVQSSRKEKTKPLWLGNCISLLLLHLPQE